MRATYGIVAALSASFSPASAAACSKQGLLLVSSYPIGNTVGGVTTFKLGNKGLEQVGELSTICGTNPSWQTLVGEDQYYCINENWDTGNGTFTSAKINKDGTLAFLGNSSTPGGPVHIALYGEGGKRAITANFASSSINAFSLDDPAKPQSLENKAFPPRPDNKNIASRPHQAVVDPTGGFIVLPDLSVDVLHIFSVDQTSLALSELPVYTFENGTGPRHAAFFKSDSKTFLYVIAEKLNAIIGFDVSYGTNTLTLSQIFNIRTDGSNTVARPGSTGAEITISPDNKFLTVSTRNDTMVEYTLVDGKKIQSDALNTFSIDAGTGQLAHVQTAPAGGILPRHFSFNKDGSLVAVACGGGGADNNRVNVFQRDVATGKIGKAVGEALLATQVNHVIFKE
ncbi:Lactonase, 7-bladed beta-propeller-domain-containing protein [Apiosordaria backusii]|uniref:Lactonase, 7-bladed beta-propeller-domain-containing protein n=1 Tax=Apiosordaria backusii TaxID=314023 RepID=A0AA40ETH7_9PEZI|nr:Lactonase, 7-bladed beta-propeller-domain-containing protein [Apiosordaria backusii]